MLANGQGGQGKAQMISAAFGGGAASSEFPSAFCHRFFERRTFFIAQRIPIFVDQ